MVAVKTLVNAAFGYVILGLLSGFYYRELTKAHDFDGRTQLATVHTHLLVLGVVFLLVVLALEKLFTLSANPMYRWFTITFHAGVIVTVAMMTVHGTMQVLDKEVSPAISDDELEKLALGDEAVVAALGGAGIRKVIVRAPKLVNIVPA